MNRKILSLLASLALVALSACGDDDSGPSGPNWKDRGLINWEKLSDGQGLWAMNAENAQAFLASASKDSMGVTQTELDLARYANSNSVTLRFTETVDTVSTRPIRTVWRIDIDRRKVPFPRQSVRLGERELASRIHNGIRV